MNMPENSLEHIHLVKDSIVNSHAWKGKLDLVNIVMIGLAKELPNFEPEPRSNAGGTIGIDVGIKAFYSDSNGNTVSNPRYLERSMRKLIREQRRLSRKQKDSHNREKQRIRVARVYEKVTNQRNDFLKKQSTMLVRENQRSREP